MNIPKKYKFISLVVSAALLFTSIPNPILAATSTPSSANTETVSEPIVTANAPDSSKPEGKIIGEVVGKRERNIKHFIMDDMTYEAAVYPEPVHYNENGTWKDIDNSLSFAKDENNTDVLQNKANVYKINISKSTKAEKLVRIKKDKYELSWNIKNGSSSTASVKSVDTKALNTLSQNDRATALTKLESTVTFSEIFPNTDLQYDITPENVKENIILKQRVDNPQYVINIFTKNLTAKLLSDNSIELSDEKDSSQKVFNLQSPIMTDSKGEVSKDIAISLEKSDIGYILTMVPSAEWLNSSDRVYPIFIDPTVDTKGYGTAGISDTYVSSGTPDTKYNADAIMKVGRQVISTNRAYIKFTLPELTQADIVTYSYLHLNVKTALSNPVQINVHNVTENWNAADLTWNSTKDISAGIPGHPQYNKVIENYKNVQNAGDVYWDITPITQGWYFDQKNYGLMLEGDAASTYAEFYASESGITKMPFATIYYCNNSGLEGYWTYHTQDTERAGTVYVNDYNGNLILLHNTLSSTGNRLPVSVNHVFNSNERNTGVSNSKYGKGWRLNYNQTVDRENINGIWYLAYTDEDGTKHHFKETSANTWKDESGLELTLLVNADGSYTMRDKKDNILEFAKLDSGSETRYLKYIKDNTGSNTITLGYSGTSLISVTDPVGRAVTLNYNAAIWKILFSKFPTPNIGVLHFNIPMELLRVLPILTEKHQYMDMTLIQIT